MLGDRGCQRGNYAAGLLKHAEFERNGSADNRVLPFNRDSQAARPAIPVARRAAVPIICQSMDAIGQSFVGVEDKGYIIVEQKLGSVHDIGNGGVCGNTKTGVFGFITDMIDPALGFNLCFPPFSLDR